MEIMTESNFRKNIDHILKEIPSENKQVEVTISENDSVVILSKREWETLQEELYLHRTDTFNYILSLMENETEADFRKHNETIK